MNSDGDLDIVADNSGQRNVYLNDGAGNFTPGAEFGTGFARIAVGDMDGNGNLDIVTGDYGENMVYLNYGALFTKTVPFGTGHDHTTSVAVGDMNSDGDLDIVAGNSGQPNVVYLNDGRGTFTTTVPIPFGPITGTTRSVAVGDLDGDGDLDIVAGNFGQQDEDGQQNVVYLSHRATFTKTVPFGTGHDHTSSVAVGDMDGDGDLDIVAGNGGSFAEKSKIIPSAEQNVVYLNDGMGNFPTGRNFGSPDHTGSVVVGDMDGDRDLDIVVGNHLGLNMVYLNDGAGNFPTGRNFGTGLSFNWSEVAVAVGDLDADGDLDVVVGNDGDHPNEVYLNNRAADTRRLPNNPSARGRGTP